MAGSFRIGLRRGPGQVRIGLVACVLIVMSAGCGSSSHPGSAPEADGGAVLADAGGSFDGGGSSGDATIASDAMLEASADVLGADASDALAVQVADGSDASSPPCPDEPLPNDCSVPNQVCFLTSSRTARCLGGTWVVCGTVLGTGCGAASGPPEGASCCEDDYMSFPTVCCVGGLVATCAGDRHLHYGASCDNFVGPGDAMPDAQDAMVEAQDAVDEAQDGSADAQDAATSE